MVWATPASGGDFAVPLDIQATTLADALQELGRQTRVELLFDREAVAGSRPTSVRGRFTPEAALDRLLAGTDLSVRRSGSGALIVERANAPPLARQDAAVSEILVVGRRTQNADIRRQESDIQPYRVVTGLQLLESGRDNLDQYFRGRVPANAQAVPPSLDVNGEPTSEIDLRGLGSNATLVLVDGRRMPAVPAALFGFRQPDLNAVPLHAVERVEVLTGSAGGIHGFGALGGVVNVVLRRDYEGGELHATGGITSRGDVRHSGLEGGFGFSPNGGQTTISLFASGARAEPLLVGERPYMVRDAELAGRWAPQFLLGMRPNGNSVAISNSSSSAPLTFKAQYGGASLGSTFTFLPAGNSGATPDLVAALLQNAGRFDSSLSEGDANSALTAETRSASLLANVRHRFNNGVEAYVDGVLLWNRGRFVSHASDARDFLSSRSPLNPFAQAVQVSYPAPGNTFERSATFDSRRYTAGLVVPLPREWRATAEAAYGSTHYSFSKSSVEWQDPFFMPNGPPLNPLGNWAEFQNALLFYRAPSTSSEAITNRVGDVSVRLAGPIFQALGGGTTLTLLAERRTSEVPSYSVASSNLAGASSTSVAGRDSTTDSVYAELRSRLLDEASATPFMRSLEVQLAVRRDRETNEFARTPQQPSTSERLRAEFSGTVYTAGAKVAPTDWLTLRGSYATGKTPPPLGDLIENVLTVFSAAASDPKRGGTAVGASGSFLLKTFGSPDLRTIEAKTASLGAILTPFGPQGIRVSVDYSRIRKDHDVYKPTDKAVLVNEDAWPHRVSRGALTDADRAKGYTGGPITMLDTRAESSAALDVETIDARFDWAVPAFGGRLGFYGDGAYYLRNTFRAPFAAALERVDYLWMPLKRRGNVGLTWSNNIFTLAANAQHFGSYRIYQETTLPFAVEAATKLQGSDRVPSQTYVDLHASWRPRLQRAGRQQEVKIDFGVVNLFDKAPPRESAYSSAQFSGVRFPAAPGYSRYGDPRQRRFVLTVSAGF